MRRSVTAAVLVCSGANCMAQTAWGVSTDGSGIPNLVAFDVTLPSAYTFFGATGIPQATPVTGLDFGSGGTGLYLSTNSATNFLYDVNQVTGAATNARGSGLLSGESLGDLSYDRFSNRMLGVGNSGIAGGGAHLYQIDLITGAATNLGAISGMTEGFAVSLAVRPADGTIFVHGTETDRWYSVNPGTLVATTLNPMGLDTNHEQGASFDGNGTLYHAVFFTQPGFGSFNNLGSIDPTTGTPSYHGFIHVGLAKIADIAFVPAPGSFALLGFAALFAGRRRA